MPGCFFQLLKDAELEQRRINLSSVKHAKFMRALQEESEIVVTFRIMDQLKKLFVLASDFCGEMIKFMYLVWDDPEKLDELENAWFSNESIVSFLHRTTVASSFSIFTRPKVPVGRASPILNKTFTLVTGIKGRSQGVFGIRKYRSRLNDRAVYIAADMSDEETKKKWTVSRRVRLTPLWTLSRSLPERSRV